MNRPEDDYLLVETCSLRITLCNKNNCAGIQISITIIVFVVLYQVTAQRDVSAQ